MPRIKVHGYDLMLARGEVLGPEVVAADWYDSVFLPAVEAIHTEGLGEVFPDAPAGDLFLRLEQRKDSAFPERGGLTFAEAAREAREVALRERRTATRARRVVKKIAPRRPGQKHRPG